MQKPIPVLNPQQIQELNNMVHGILEENKKKLDDILSETVRIENTTILNLYKLVVEEWTKKQKIIDNLCYFSLTMMASVHLLWDQKQDSLQRLKNAEILIDSLQKHIEELNDENDKNKMKINEAETHIQSISGEKDKFQELYKSQSCYNFTDQGLSSQMQLSKDCLDCEHYSLLQQQKDEFIQQTGKCLMEKQSQILQLREQKKQLQRKFEELMEEHKLAKMEIELAEIAVSDALSYRQSSLSNRSQIMNRSDQIYTTKSHAQFMNGQLECFSNFNQSFHEETQILPNQITNQGNQIIFSSQLQVGERASQIDQKNIVNAFKKKSSKKNEERKYYTQTDQIASSSVCLKSSVKNSQIKLGKDKKTVSLQCNLLKNVPQIRLFPRKTPQVIEKKSFIKSNTNLSKQPKKQKNQMTQSAKTLSKSQITKPVQQQKDKGSIGRFFNFISSKIITNRIKVK